MAVCVVLNSNGTLSPTGEDVSVCTGYVLVSGSEYSMMAAIDTALGVPSSTDAMSWFMGPFSLVVFLYVAARMAGSVVGMFRA